MLVILTRPFLTQGSIQRTYNICVFLSLCDFTSAGHQALQSKQSSLSSTSLNHSIPYLVACNCRTYCQLYTGPAWAQASDNTAKVPLYLFATAHFPGSQSEGVILESQPLARDDVFVLYCCRLFVITESFTQLQYASLLASSDIFVLPTRGEGWGLPMVGTGPSCTGPPL
jgi:hypothetical protein